MHTPLPPVIRLLLFLTVWAGFLALVLSSCESELATTATESPAPADTALEDHPERVYLGTGYLTLILGRSGWERDTGWPLPSMRISQCDDTLVLQTEKDHLFDVEPLGHKPAARMVFKAAAYRYVPIDSSLVPVPRWQWRRLLDRLDRLEQVNR